MDKIKVNEIFWSVQGEGARKGFPSIFLRLSGCSLRCDYCDSKDSWSEGEYFSEDEIITKVKKIGEKYPSSQIVITGGEPLEQNIRGLVMKLKKNGFYISIETNGIHDSDIDFDWWAVSPKDITDFKINEKLWNKISEIKLIVNENLDPGRIKEISRQKGDIPIFLQPRYPDPDRFKKTFELFEKCIMTGMKNIRLGLQLHRSFNIR